VQRALVPVGRSAEVYLVPAGPSQPELVLRIVATDEAARREAAVQRAVSSAGFPAPSIVLVGTTTAGFERPFLLMERAEGHELLPGSSWNPIERLRALGQLSRVVADAMVALHALPIGELGDSLETTTPNELTDELERWAAQHSLEDCFGPAFDWLDTRMPVATAPVVCHGDLHAQNILVENDAVTAVIDWELARLADPEWDIARTATVLSIVPQPVSAVVRPVISRLGRRVARGFIGRYDSCRPIDAGRLEWHNVWHCVRLLLLVAEHRIDGGTTTVGKMWSARADDLSARLRQLAGMRIDVPQ
jgi:aminoglycoside phosphotransferase (APT) family kinase protein